MNRKACRAVLLAVSTLTISQVLPAQSPLDSVMIATGALRFIGTQGQGHAAIAVDTTGHFYGASSANPNTLRSAAATTSLSVRIGQRSEFVTCQNQRDFRTCTLSGVDAVVTLGNAFFRGDSASVRLRIVQREKGASDLSEKVYVIRFVRKGASWEYVEARLSSLT